MNVNNHVKEEPNDLSKVTFLLGGIDILNKSLPPYAQETINFLNDISTALLHDSEAKKYPDIVSFAFWCRKANIIRLKEKEKIEKNRIGRGVVFHIAPSNIPINFAFTYAFGLLAGNANIVRLPSKKFPQTDIMVRIFRIILKEYPEIDARTVWLQYPPDTKITSYFSKKANARMLWGGDETIQSIRRGDSNPKSIDLCFTDRYSIGMIDGNSVLNASDQELAKLAENFYNDTWLMDQNACSSPQLLLWFHSDARAKKRFWDTVVSVAKKRYRLQPSSAVDKYLQLCIDASMYDFIDSMEHDGNILYRIQLQHIPEENTSLRGTCGYFYEYNLTEKDILSGLKNLDSIITEKYQTVTYYGIDPRILHQWVLENRLKGIDRIVPFGKAMDISVIWDGYDIIRMLSRIVHVET